MLENASPTVTAQLEGALKIFWKTVFIQKKKNNYAVTTFQTTHYIKRERLKQEAALPKELLENTEASHMPIWDVQGVAVL